MFNHCVLSGIVCFGNALGLEWVGHSCIRFLLAIQCLGKPAGLLGVLSSSHSAFLIAKYLHEGDRVAVMGFLSIREWQSDSGHWNYQAILNATDIALLKEDDLPQKLR